MPDTMQAPRLRAELWELPNVECFLPGTWNGKPWDASDIDAVVRNFAKLRDRMTPTVGIGHDDASQLTAGLASTAVDDSGLPAFGIVSGLRKGTGRSVLVADLKDLPAWLAKLVAARTYRSCSIELCDDGAPGSGLGDVSGPVLKRVCLLGLAIPAVKGLRELPSPQVQTYGEKNMGTTNVKTGAPALGADYHGTRSAKTGLPTSGCATGAGTSSAYTGRPLSNAATPVSSAKTGQPIAGGGNSGSRPPTVTGAAAFSEDTMSRKEMLAYLAKNGYDPGRADALTDDQPAELLRVIEGTERLDRATMGLGDDDQQDDAIVQAYASFAEKRTRKAKGLGRINAAELVRGWNASKHRDGSNKYLYSEFLNLHGPNRGR
jgi:hypothetical protein